MKSPDLNSSLPLAFSACAIVDAVTQILTECGCEKVGVADQSVAPGGAAHYAGEGRRSKGDLVEMHMYTEYMELG